MTLIEAIRQSLAGKTIVSCEGRAFTPEELKPKRLSDTAYVSEAITTVNERKGKWSVLEDDDQ